MGGWGSGTTGGDNRRKNHVGSSINIDSFYFAKHLQLLKESSREQYDGFMRWSNGNSVRFVLSLDKLCASQLVLLCR